MNKVLAGSLLFLIVLSGCASANITVVKWDSGEKGSNVQTRCERVV
jgi:hypothetical protein